MSVGEASIEWRGAGPLQTAYEAVDWAAGPLGAVETWTPALLAAVDTMLHTRFPVTLFWGPEFVLVYNEAYTELIADKHPGALGRPARDVFPEAWDVIGPMMEQVMAGGGPTWVVGAPVPLERRGFLEECYFTFSYSPVHGADRRVEGVLDIAAETTEQVVAARRQELLAQLGDQLAAVEDVDELADRVRMVLAGAPADLPLANLHLPGVPPTTTTPGEWMPAAPPYPLAGRRLVADEDEDGTTAWLPLPLAVLDPVERRATTAPDANEADMVSAHESILVVRCSERLVFDRGYRSFLRLVASAVAQAVGRLVTRAAERALHEQERRFSTALQRSLLTGPMQQDRLQVAVRYEPATEAAQIGGDWHDSFALPDGALALTIGDVAGHDRDAAAAMAQVRNMFRGIAYTLEEPPARVVSALDQAMIGLDVTTIATAILARVEPTSEHARTDLHLMRWTNAGHPPPVLLQPDGSVVVLSGHDLLLGLHADTERNNHAAMLEPGATVVFYTDGLIERRTSDLDHGLDWLTAALAERAGDDPEHLADALLQQKLPNPTDDIAILVLRVHPHT
ncbi:SpoIIE family protein phosphatase [uncultured Nocardioides sp.]|uniref:Serine phosphatase RsbU, regulator of sigma subunit n=1 Tax=uncultured Nocardioides sp. TaxID=198441 RepID=A0A6J4NFC8_9ACTN|nr:SpoIIE family protein phosphatase [uncultured Nocardioides sp.]CAA9383546.1 MAG: Serine phosphatase RsbU, regulator of sigma subunit [uncultured Nocardioides sp.]